MHQSPAGPGKPDHAATPSRIPLGTLCLLIAVTAIGGGVALALHPDGSAVHLPLSLLQHSPFRSYLVPGLLLSVFVGGTHTVAGLLQLRGHARAQAAALLAGLVLVIWITCEMLLLRMMFWFQLAYLGLGALVIIEALAASKQSTAIGVANREGTKLAE